MSFSLPTDKLAGEDGKPSVTWLSWLSKIHAIALSVQQSGTTAERPTKVLWIGRRFYDVTLGKPVYLAGVNPSVWKDAAGVTV